jgi:hypothetical protein
LHRSDTNFGLTCGTYEGCPATKVDFCVSNCSLCHFANSSRRAEPGSKKRKVQSVDTAASRRAISYKVQELQARMDEHVARLSSPEVSGPTGARIRKRLQAKVGSIRREIAQLVAPLSKEKGDDVEAARPIKQPRLLPGEEVVGEPGVVAKGGDRGKEAKAAVDTAMRAASRGGSRRERQVVWDTEAAFSTH